VLVDPFGTTFDSQTGVPVSGVTVTLITTPMASRRRSSRRRRKQFPVDHRQRRQRQRQRRHHLRVPAGEYRFPFVPAGNYHFVLTPPAGFSVPSSRTAGDLAADPDTSTFSCVRLLRRRVQRAVGPSLKSTCPWTQAPPR